MEDAFGLQRFVDAQEPVYAAALAELHRGRKQGHWMWFIFPQITGLGVSPTSRRFAIRSREEAAAYLMHPILGPRLLDAIGAVLSHPDLPADHIFGPVDAAKFRSSMTLFDAAGGGAIFAQAIDTFFAGASDAATLELIG